MNCTVIPPQDVKYEGEVRTARAAPVEEEEEEEEEEAAPATSSMALVVHRIQPEESKGMNFRTRDYARPKTFGKKGLSFSLEDTVTRVRMAELCTPCAA